MHPVRVAFWLVTAGAAGLVERLEPWSRNEAEHERRHDPHATPGFTSWLDVRLQD
ncbi:hypothetical protein AB0M46_42365 [Dactylosporangium sp. NPDC051485]|uniref:hypothetical protein n=1 Tax=Dactylosporangium sp. NPDC051485 TaxID=3154846 RepID=UPI00341D82BB